MRRFCNTLWCEQNAVPLKISNAIFVGSISMVSAVFQGLSHILSHLHQDKESKSIVYRMSGESCIVRSLSSSPNEHRIQTQGIVSITGLRPRTDPWLVRSERASMLYGLASRSDGKYAMYRASPACDDHRVPLDPFDEGYGGSS